MAIERVKVRVTQGGHDIPPDIIRRRFAKGWDNFQRVYSSLVDSWQVFDNSGEAAKLIDEGGN